MKTVIAHLTLVVATLMPGQVASAQCGPAWLPGAPAPGPLGSVFTVLPLPGGELVAGGIFPVADSSSARNVARWDGGTWRAMGSGANSVVRCLARLPDGSIVAAGAFTTMGGQPCNRIARWNGAAWSPIGTGFAAGVLALQVLPNGDLVAAGQFPSAVARWNGATWTPLGTGLSGGVVRTLALRPNGDLIAGGEFPGHGLFRWNGLAWSAVAGFDPGSPATITASATLGNGSVAIAGDFVIGGLLRRLAIWDGTTLQPLDPPLAPAPSALFGGFALGAASNGDLIVGAVTTTSLARWNGTSWTVVPGLPGRVLTLLDDGNGRLLIGSPSTPPPFVHSVWREEPNGWRGLGAEPPPAARDVIRRPDGGAVLGGSFASFGGVAAANIARWDGTVWSPLGAGVDGAVHTMANAPNGDLIVAGAFQQAGGAPAQRIARWNGANWSTIGNGLPVEPTALVVAPDGGIFALDPSGLLWEFRGTSWSSRPVLGYANTDAGLAALPNGDIVISSFFEFLSVYRPTTGEFTLVPGAPPSLQDMIVDAQGILLTAGATGVHRWDGTSWTQLLAGTVASLTLLPDGDLLAAGAPRTFGAGSPQRTVYQLDATGWSGFATIDGVVQRLAATAQGDVFAIGSITAVEGAVAVDLALARAACPAVAQVVGSGCTGGAGPVTLQALDRPWVGGTLHTTALGMTTNSLALQLVSLQPTLIALPGGAAGCSLFGLPLLSSVLLPVAGVADGSFAIPPQPILAGTLFRVQIVGVELSPSGIERLTSSNGLELTIGWL